FPGVPNTGSGGGGARNGNGGDGGSGIVVVRYTTADFDPPLTVRGTNVVPNLFAFRLNPYLADMRVNSVTLTLSAVGGVADSDWSNVALMEDSDGSGYIDPWEHTQVGGLAAVDTGAGTITFSAPFIVPAAGMNYIMRADLAGLQDGDTFTLGLAMSDIVVVSADNTSEKAIKFSGSATPVTHTASSEIVWDGEAGDGKWNSSRNWDPDMVPVPQSDVTIDADVSVTAAAGEPALRFNSLTLGSGAGAYSPTLTLSTTIASGGNITVYDNAVLVHDTAQEVVTGGALSVEDGGTVVSDSVQRLYISGDFTVKSGGVVYHNGNTNILTSSLNIGVGGAFDLQAGGLVHADGRGYSTGGPGAGVNGAANGGSGGGHGGAGG
ncbi:MAG TPA: hypothetical protein PK523_13270, partial [Elusimicrobiales bacterium]|nr:hypothetical protein [Elusimicrobiales bacterium]